MFEVLIYLFEVFLYNDIALTPDTTSLTEELETAGFNNKEIDKALNWLQAVSISDITEAFVPQNAHSLRVFTAQEYSKLGDEGYGLLLYLEQAGLITPVLRELIIERAMAIELASLDIKQFKWVVLMILGSFTEHKEEVEWIEDIIFAADEKSNLH